MSVTDISCKIPRSNNSVTFNATSSLANVCISSAPSNFASNNSTPITCGGSGANIATVTVTILGIQIPISVTLKTSATVASKTQTFTKTGAAPYSVLVPFSLSQGLGSTIENLTIEPVLNVPVVSFLIQPILNTVLFALKPVLVAAISPVLATVGGILDSVLSILGISLNNLYIDVNTLNCGATRLTL